MSSITTSVAIFTYDHCSVRVPDESSKVTALTIGKIVQMRDFNATVRTNDEASSESTVLGA